MEAEQKRKRFVLVKPFGFSICETFASAVLEGYKTHKEFIIIEQIYVLDQRQWQDIDNVFFMKKKTNTQKGGCV